MLAVHDLLRREIRRQVSDLVSAHRGVAAGTGGGQVAHVNERAVRVALGGAHAEGSNQKENRARQP